MLKVLIYTAHNIVSSYDKFSFSHKDLGVEICPLPGFLILQGFGFQFNHRLAESTLCLESHKAPKSKTSEVYLQISGYDP